MRMRVMCGGVTKLKGLIVQMETELETYNALDTLKGKKKEEKKKKRKPAREKRG